MAYFTVVSNHGSYRATSHEFKLVFLHRTTVVAVDEDIIPKTCFNMFPFSELLNMTQDYDFLVGVIGLLTSVGEEKEYAKEGKIVKMIVLELTLKDLTVRCALFGDYVNQVNHFLASGYVEQPVVVIQLAKVKFFRGQVGLQNVMYATQILFNPDLPEVVEFRQRCNGTQPLFIANEGKVVSLEDDFIRLTRKCTIEELQDNNQEGSFIIFGTIQGIVEDRGWWYSACVCGKGIYPQNGAYYCDFCLKHITNVTPRFKIKITVEDHSGEGIFLLFDREASYLLKKSCANLFIEVQRDASLVCGDTYPPIFQGLIGKKLLLKVDTKDFDSLDHGCDIIFRSTAGQLQRIYETHALYWPLQYPLLFPYGEDGYQLNIPYRGQVDGYVPGRRTRVSLREFICFCLQIREQEDGIIHKCR
ncbi:hypothetical protein AHAS_Ahas19G0301500 [Arachis hypogaea]